MTDDERATFDEIVSGEELDYLRDAAPVPRRRRGLLYHASRILLIVMLAAVVFLILWGFGLAIVWLGEHGILAATKSADTLE